jgi:hypothetical protein
MLAELILHVGPEKTGTTTIQESLAAAAPALTANGTFVPLADGESPGHHLPILREVVGNEDYRSRYAYSQDSLSLQDTLAEQSSNGYGRMLLSAEDFSAPSTRGDVLRLIQLINPRRLTVIHALRSAVPWCLSWHAQDIKYGLFDRGSWTIDQFSSWFVENVLTIDDAAHLWSDGPWAFDLRTLLLPGGGHHDICRMFTDGADLPVALEDRPPVNTRMSPCELHLLQAINIHTFDPGLPLHERALAREPLLSVLNDHGVPPHECECATQLDSDIQSRIEDLFSQYVDRIVSASGSIEGRSEDVTTSVPPDHAIHSRFPTPRSALTSLSFLMDVVRDGVIRRSENQEATEFWHAQADAYVAARDHWQEQAQNWQAAADEFASARDHWQEQAQNWQAVAREFEEARDYWRQQAEGAATGGSPDE